MSPGLTWVEVEESPCDAAWPVSAGSVTVGWIHWSSSSGSSGSGAAGGHHQPGLGCCSSTGGSAEGSLESLVILEECQL